MSLGVGAIVQWEGHYWPRMPAQVWSLEPCMVSWAPPRVSAPPGVIFDIEQEVNPVEYGPKSNLPWSCMKRVWLRGFFPQKTLLFFPRPPHTLFKHSNSQSYSWFVTDIHSNSIPPLLSPSSTIVSDFPNHNHNRPITVTVITVIPLVIDLLERAQ